MRRIILTIVLLLLILTVFKFNSIVYAQNIDTSKEAWRSFGKIFGVELPGVDCGVGGMKDGTEKCCNTKPSLLIKSINDFIPKDMIKILQNVMGSIPLLGPYLVNSFGVGNDTRQKIDNVFNIQNNLPETTCIYGQPQGVGLNCNCVATEAATLNRSVAQLCYKYLSQSKEVSNCLGCAATNGMWTGIGCVPLSLQSFVSKYLLSTGIGLGGVIALLCIIYSSYMMQTSRGNPEKIKKAQENLTSCILGLMLIIFSVFIMRLIGVDILKIPGFMK